MQVTLMKNFSENNTIGKALTSISIVNCVLKDDCSVFNPVFLFKTDPTKMYDTNYLYADDFERFYFIDKIVPALGSGYEIYCSVDVLESFKSDILNLTCIINKQELGVNSDLYIDDGDWIFENKQSNTIIDFPNGFNQNGEYILITAG